MKPYGYYAIMIYVVDAPEKRGPTFKPVTAGSTYKMENFCSTLNHALTWYESSLRGEQDFGAEFVRDVEVIALYNMPGADRTRFRNDYAKTARVKMTRKNRTSKFHPAKESWLEERRREGRDG